MSLFLYYLIVTKCMFRSIKDNNIYINVCEMCKSIYEM